MLERMKAVLRNRKENDKGFSLVELAVVIVIIGILVAVAIPIFLGMQASAEEAADEAAAANGAAMVAAELAKGAEDVTEDDLTALVNNALDAGAVVTGTTLDTYCVTVNAATKGNCSST